MPIPDDARFGPACDPQSRKEGVAYDSDTSPTSLAEEAARKGSKKTNDQFVPSPPDGPVAGTRN